MNIPFSKTDVIYNSLESRLSLTRKKELLFNFARSLLITFISFIALAFIFIVLETLFKFSIGARTVIFWGFVSTFTTTALFFIINYVLKRNGIIKLPDTIAYSKMVGSKFEVIKDSLPNSLSLYRNVKDGNGGKPGFSNELVVANLEKVDSRAKDVNFSSFIPFGMLKKLSIIFIASLVFYSIWFAIFPGPLFGGLNRLVNYNYNFINSEYGISFEIAPGDVEVVKGDGLDVSIIVRANKEGLDIEELNFYVKEVTKDGVEILSEEKELTASSNGYFTTRIENINNKLIYYAEFGGAISDKYEITVSDYPVVKSFTVSIYPPELTGMPSKTLNENEGDIFCPQGSRIYFDLKSNEELSSAGVSFNGQYTGLDISGDGATGSLNVAENGTYKFVLKDTDGNENKNPAAYNIKIIADEPPKISIIEPKESNFILSGEKELILRARISDDYGFSKLSLSYQKTNLKQSAAGRYTQVNIPIKNLNATSLEVPYLWSISGLGLRTGERIEYFMEVTDNTGKTTRSEIRTLQYKSPSEILKETEQMTKELKTDMESVLEDAGDIQKQLQDLKRKAQNNEELGLNEQQKQELQKNVENLQNNLNKTQQKIDQSLNEMKQNNMLSEKTLEEYMKLQELFNKINTPELQKMLEKLKEALKKKNNEEIRDAMKEFNFDEEAFKKNLEKIMELMKKIENLQEFGKLTEKLDDIQKQQEDLKDKTEASDQNDKDKMNELSQKQEDIKKQTDEFKKELQDLIDKMNQMKEQMSPEDLQELMKKMEQMKTQEKMQNSENQLQKSEKSNSEKTQEEIMEDLKELNEQMQDALSKQLDMQDMSQKMMDKMAQIKKSLEQLSKDQQELKEDTEDMSSSDKQEMNDAKKEQDKLQQKLSEDINNLMNMSKEGAPITPELGKELGNSYNSMDNAGDNLSKGQKKDATGNQGKAKQSLDNAIGMLGDMMQQMKQDGKNSMKGKGNKMSQLMEKLSQIISQQQGLKGKMSQFGKNGNPTGKDGQGNLTQEQKEQLGRMKLEQQQISKSLEQLNKELEEEKQRSGEKVLGDLNEVQKEMNEIVKDLTEQNLTKETLKKQNRILSRMLDAQLSQREKDFEQKRESRPGTNYSRTSPPEIVLSGPNSFNALKEDFLKLQKEGYTDDYEELITKYLLELKKSGYISEE